jgi:hypothetical protein
VSCYSGEAREGNLVSMVNAGRDTPSKKNECVQEGNSGGIKEKTDVTRKVGFIDFWLFAVANVMRLESM